MARHLARVPILLLGCGGVGRCLLQCIVDSRELHSSLGIHISVIAVCDSVSMVVPNYTHRNEIENMEILAIIGHKTDHKPLKTFQSEYVDVSPSPSPSQLAEMAKVGILVDCTAGNTEELLVTAVGSGASVVLANKKPLTSTLEVFDTLTKDHRRFRYEATVGAGLPILCTLSRLQSSNDPVHRIAGALSGTLGYVITKLQNGSLLSEAVMEAKERGYTEPDPRDDLSGMDVARKALILARTIGWRLTMDDVKVESLFPPSMGPESMHLDAFLYQGGLATLDKEMKARVEKAREKERVLRYAAVLEEGRCRVGLVEEDPRSAVGRLEGTDNVVEIGSASYLSSPLSIQGAGAGALPTAQGVLTDIVDLGFRFV